MTPASAIHSCRAEGRRRGHARADAKHPSRGHRTGTRGSRDLARHRCRLPHLRPQPPGHSGYCEPRCGLGDLRARLLLAWTRRLQPIHDPEAQPSSSGSRRWRLTARGTNARHAHFARSACASSRFGSARPAGPNISLERLRRILARQPMQMGGDDKVFLRAQRPSGDGSNGTWRVVDLFSGCGGLTLGVEEAARLARRSVDVRLAVECDPAIAATYEANFSPAHGAEASLVSDWFDGRFGERRSLLERRTAKQVGRVDVLIGGPPCQGHSTLNNHTRGDDPKNALYLMMVRAAEVLRPRIVIIENVPAIEQDSANTVNVAAGQLKKIGYKVDHRVISVADLGVPQLRARHVLMAHSEVQPDLRSAVDQACAHPRTLRWAIGDLLSSHGATRSTPRASSVPRTGDAPSTC